MGTVVGGGLNKILKNTAHSTEATTTSATVKSKVAFARGATGVGGGGGATATANASTKACRTGIASLRFLCQCPQQHLLLCLRHVG